MDALHGPSLAFVSCYDIAGIWVASLFPQECQRYRRGQEGARVLSLQEVGQFTCKGPMMTGTVYIMGATCVLDIGGNTVIVSSRPQQAWDQVRPSPELRPSSGQALSSGPETKP